MRALLVLAVVTPLAGAAVGTLWRRRRRLQRVVALVVAVGEVGIGVTLLAAGPEIHVTALAGWPERFAIILVGDPLAALFIAVTGVLAVAVLVAAMAAGDDDHASFHPLVLVLVGGVCGVYLVGDLFNLFVWMEVTLVSSSALAVLQGTERQVRAVVVYVSANLLGTLLVVTGVALTYATSGSVNFAVLASQPPPGEGPPLVPAAILFVAFGVKAALLPLGGWLPVTYPAAPRAAGALFAGLLTTVGVVVLYRLSTILYPGSALLLTPLLGVACATAVVAALAAAGQRNLGPALAFIVMTQAGLAVIGAGLASAAALTAGTFFLLQDVVAKTAVYLAAARLGDAPGPGAASAPAAPVTAAFAIAALSLSGVPPTAGFAGKALLLSAALADDRWFVAATILGGSLLTAIAFLGLWRVRLTPGLPGPNGTSGTVRGRIGSSAPPVVLAGVLLAVGLLPATLYSLVEPAAAVLTDPSAYVEAVLL